MIANQQHGITNLKYFETPNKLVCNLLVSAMFLKPVLYLEQNPVCLHHEKVKYINIMNKEATTRKQTLRQDITFY